MRPHRLHQKWRRTFWLAPIGLTVLTERQQDGVNCHLIHCKEDLCNHKPGDDGNRDRQDRRRKVGIRVLACIVVVIELCHGKGHDTTCCCDCDLAQEEQDVADEVDGHKAQRVLCVQAGGGGEMLPTRYSEAIN